MYKLTQKLLPRLAGVFFDVVVAYLLSSIWSIIEIGLFGTHEILAKLFPGKSARDIFVFALIYFSWRGVLSFFIGVSLGQYLSGLEARGGAWWKLRLLGPVRVMLDLLDPLDLSKFKERLTGTKLEVANPKSASIFSAFVILFSLLLLPASSFLHQTHLSSKLKFTELTIPKNKVAIGDEVFRSNTFRFFGGIDKSKYLILPKYSLRSILGKRNISPEFYLYQNDNGNWIEISSEGRWNWAEFFDSFNSEYKTKKLPKLEMTEDNPRLAQVGSIQKNLTEEDAQELVQLFKLSFDSSYKSLIGEYGLRNFSEKFLGSFGVIFNDVQIWHMDRSSFLLLSDRENIIVLSLNSLRPSIIRLQFSGSEASLILTHQFLKEWLSASTWVFDYDRPFELDTSRLDFFSALDFFPQTSAMAQSRPLYEYWGGQFGTLKRVVQHSSDRVLKNLWIDSVESMLALERSKKTINPDWVQMMEDFMSGIPGEIK